MKKIYEAIDGTQFEDELACVEYEEKLAREEIADSHFDVVMLDSEFKPINNWWDYSGDDIFGVYIKDDKAYEKIRNFFQYDTVLPWNEVTFEEMEDNWYIGRHFLYEDDAWYCVEEEVQRNLCRNQEMMGYFDTEG